MLATQRQGSFRSRPGWRAMLKGLATLPHATCSYNMRCISQLRVATRVEFVVHVVLQGVAIISHKLTLGGGDGRVHNMTARCVLQHNTLISARGLIIDMPHLLLGGRC